MVEWRAARQGPGESRRDSEWKAGAETGRTAKAAQGQRHLVPELRLAGDKDFGRECGVVGRNETFGAGAIVEAYLDDVTSIGSRPDISGRELTELSGQPFSGFAPADVAGAHVLAWQATAAEPGVEVRLLLQCRIARSFHGTQDRDRITEGIEHAQVLILSGHQEVVDLAIG